MSITMEYRQLQALAGTHLNEIRKLYPDFDRRSKREILEKALMAVGAMTSKQPITDRKRNSPPPPTPSPIATETASAEHEQFPQGTIIQRRWIIEEPIGRGGFGSVYRAHEKQDANKKVAVKLFTKKPDVNELTVLHEVYPERLLGEGSVTRNRKKIQFIILPLYGPSLSQRHAAESYSFDELKLIVPSLFTALEEFHEAGWIHDDIKPGNIVYEDDIEGSNNVLLIDFGLAQRYSMVLNWLKRPERIGFRGTLRYASIAAHKLQPCTRRDDLESLFYTLVSLVQPLPWAKTWKETKAQQRELIGAMKVELPETEYFSKLPKNYQQWYRQVMKLSPTATPKYSAYVTLLLK